jgi:hypothetical protein
MQEIPREYRNILEVIIETLYIAGMSITITESS